MKSPKHSPTTGSKYKADVATQKLNELIMHLRSEIPKLNAPKAQAIFETAAEVLLRLQTIFLRYQESDEPTMREEGKFS